MKVHKLCSTGYRLTCTKNLLLWHRALSHEDWKRVTCKRCLKKKPARGK